MAEAERVETLKGVPARLERTKDLIREGDYGGALVEMTAAAKVLTDVLMGLDWDRIRAWERREPDRAVLADAARAAVLNDAAGAWGTPEMPANAFLVGVQGDRLVLLRPVPRVLTRGQALNLAAWLAALADFDGSMFDALLRAVRES